MSEQRVSADELAQCIENGECMYSWTIGDKARFVLDLRDARAENAKLRNRLEAIKNKLTIMSCTCFRLIEPYLSDEPEQGADDAK